MLNNSNHPTQCPLYDDGHHMTYDVEQRNPAETVFVCNCGAIKIEPEDAGTGA